MRRRLTALLLCLALCLLPAPQAGAHDAVEHWNDIRYVLFGQERTPSSLDKDQQQKLNALLWATQLCIDQANMTGSSHLTRLQSLEFYKGISEIPASIEEINLYPGSNNHRIYTHLGWDYNYANDAFTPDWDVRWQRRQDMLRAVVEQTFDFNNKPYFLDRILGRPRKGESFCKLLYYIHILGDHTAFDYSSYHRRANGWSGIEQVMPLASTRGDSVISELEEVIVDLLGRKGTSQLIVELRTINNEVVKLLNDPDAMRTEEGVKQYTDYAQDVLDTLADYIPKLLKEKDFFSKVFC